jgi:hypothetical protein
MTTAFDLESLLISLDGMALDEIELYARHLYRQAYLNKGHVGIHKTHDEHLLVFHGRTFDHAFYTTSDKLCHPERKDVLRKGSIERIRWIGALAAGEVPGSACFEVPSPTGRRRPPNRFYAVFETPFVVWLEPRTDGGWNFASAYPLSIEEIRKHQRGGRTVWKRKEKSPVIDRLTGPEALSKVIKP